MLISLRSQLRRHRRRAFAVLAVLLVAMVALTAHAAMASSTHNNDMGTMTTICLVAASLAAVVAGGTFVVQRMFSRPRWLMPAPVVPDFAFIPTFSGLFARAGPPPLLQVFRL
jgi:hypothetical protein